ncbi:hypothetical protein METY_3341 [Methylopila sp. Yamaguchi]|nr:hypothetical protein METY_3341 [Methylopila sp. Yamaguchi]
MTAAIAEVLPTRWARAVSEDSDMVEAVGRGPLRRFAIASTTLMNSGRAIEVGWIKVKLEAAEQAAASTPVSAQELPRCGPLFAAGRSFQAR